MCMGRGGGAGQQVAVTWNLSQAFLTEGEIMAWGESSRESFRVT